MKNPTDVIKSYLSPQGFIDREWLIEHRHRQDDNHIYYLPCPICGQTDHCLSESRPPYGKALVVCCYQTMKMLYIRELDVFSIMEKEENEFKSLLESFKGKLPEKLTPQQAFIYRTQDGVPAELLEVRLDNTVEFYRLLEEHKAKSGNTFRKEIF